MSEPKNEAVVRAAKKAYAASATARFDKLMAEGRKWSRRHTIAENKMLEVYSRVCDLCYDLAREKDGAK